MCLLHFVFFLKNFPRKKVWIAEYQILNIARIFSGVRQKVYTTCCILASGMRENEERMRKWREIRSLHFLIFSFCPPSLTIYLIKNCHIWENNSGSNSLQGSSASCVGLIVRPYLCLFSTWVSSLSVSFTKFKGVAHLNPVLHSLNSSGRHLIVCKTFLHVGSLVHFMSMCSVSSSCVTCTSKLKSPILCCTGPGIGLDHRGLCICNRAFISLHTDKNEPRCSDTRG